ncbi:MAG: hypothetical protein NTY64_21945, partial [Deltaproteobacteria bacterium]|nr:hypothetical protein [Deltaproteobacteria bacterium]
MLTIGYIFISIFSLFFFGLPLACLLGTKGKDPEEKWIIAPFLGLSLIVLVLQNLVYLDIPIGRSFLWLWIGAALIWVWLWKSGRWPFSPFPLLLLAVALGAYLIQGAGLLAAGAEAYVGRAWHDFFNYTAIAQFLTDYPFHSAIQEVQNQPYLFAAIIKKADRIGPSILQGFLAASTGVSAKTAFMPTMFLSSFLTVLAIYGLARKLLLSSKWALLAGAAAGVLPALALVELESFFSQALVIPFLFIWPLLLSEYLRHPTWQRALVSALVLATGTSLYTEFFPIFLAVALFGFLSEAFGKRKNILTASLSLILMIGFALLLNVGFFQGIIAICQRVANSNVLSGIYPWAYATEGLQRLWLGDLAVRFPLAAQFFRPITYFLIG